MFIIVLFLMFSFCIVLLNVLNSGFFMTSFASILNVIVFVVVVFCKIFFFLVFMLN